ncbi:hypothetical protein B9Y88_15245 [Stenotrophomonas maltophilia]|nr:MULTISPECIES: hypothetical protein [unclassified Stenotrophomonas]MCU1123511.1 hypothetical protein [Stenotrophomonas maltophilia]MDH1243180.1 hypothetical protein [Stenotrophomonas sp. GD03948]MDH1577467.1 hypothetical protein [Stenotrophomonas sp. GD03744]PJL77239.1 hypothetical protein B9Y88_15245 [Stenotrophomonas maltophilia]
MTTDNKTLSVDVLNEMERASERLFDAGLHGDLSLDVARAAVAELIEVARQFDSYASADFGDTSILDNEELWDRLSAALARVKGESA